MEPINAPYPLTNDQIASFQTNGYLLLRGVASQAEIKEYRPLIRDAVKRLNQEVRAIHERDTYGKAFLQTMNLWEDDAAVKRFTLAGKFAGIAAGILGVEKVRLYHDQALFKEPGGGLTPWHQDQYYWPLESLNTVTMWMPLMDITTEMGILTFAGGSHKDGLVRNINISDESEKELDDYVREKKYPVFMPPFMRAGDATFHYGTTLHKAPGNSTEVMREVMTIIYFADRTKVAVPRNEAQEKDRQRWLSSAAPGSLANGKLNPLLAPSAK